MGLDTVELVMEIEDEFGLHIPDADAELIQTVGQLHAYVCHTLRPRARAVCPSARAFYNLRRILTAQLPVPRRGVRPATRVSQLLTDDFRERWHDIADAAGLKPFFSFDGKAPVRLPASYSTVRDLVRRMTFPKPFPYPPGDGELEREVWRRVLRIVSEQVGVRESDLHPHTHFINDLNMD